MEKTPFEPNLKIVGQVREDAPELGLPLYLSAISAGWPSPAEDYIDQTLDLNKKLIANSAETFILRAAGESMLGAGIHDGDMLIVDRSIQAEHNRVVIAAVDGNLTVKRLLRKQGRVWLAPENSKYKALDITEREHVLIWGVVTYVVHQL